MQFFADSDSVNSSEISLNSQSVLCVGMGMSLKLSAPSCRKKFPQRVNKPALVSLCDRRFIERTLSVLYFPEKGAHSWLFDHKNYKDSIEILL